MKKTNLLLSLLAVVAMLSSCTKYAEEEITPVLPSLAGGSVTQFKATNGEYSRAGLNADHKSIWHEGDNMTIVKFNPGQTTPQVIHAAALNSTISADGRTMIFASDLPIHAAGEQYAIYPAQSNKDVDNYTSGKIGSRTFSIELPEQEIGADGSFRYPALLGHWSEANDGGHGSFIFSNPFTMLHFKLKKPASETEDLVLTHIQINGNNGELMWGAAEASIIDNGDGTYTKDIEMVQGAEPFVNLDLRIDGVGQTITTEGRDFYVCIPAQNYSKGMTLNFFCEGNEEAAVWYMEQPLMTRGVDCSGKKNTLVNLPELELNVEKTGIYTSLVRATATTLAMSWTTKTDNVAYLSQQAPSTKANYDSEKKNSYIVELWTNNRCQYNTGTLVQSWLIRNNEYYDIAGDDSRKEDIFTKNYAPQRFIFGYLNPATTYYFRVMYSAGSSADVNDLSQWKVLEHPREIKTLDPFSSNVETILFEDFRDCVMGGDFSTRSAGYISYQRSNYSDVLAAVINIYDTADSETASDIEHRLKLPNLEGVGNKGQGSPWAVCPQSKETALFSTMCNMVAGTTGACPGNYKTYKGYTSRLKDWAWYADDNTPGTILMRAGYLKVGALYKHAGIVTPQLSMLSGPSTITVEFYACAYGASTLDKGELPIAVKVLEGVSVYKDTSTTTDERKTKRDSLNRIDVSTIAAATANVKKIMLEGNQYSWKKYRVTFTGVTKTSRIAFCSDREEPNTNNRFLLDDVHIYLEQTESLSAKLIKATDSTLAFAWSSTAANVPTMAQARPDTKISFSNEYADTYAVALYDANKTLIGKLSGIYFDGADETTSSSTNPAGNGYNYLYTSVQKPPRWIFTGLEPSTTYYFKVWNTTKGLESGFLEASTIAPSYERDDVVPLNETAVPGHVLLYENFSNMLYGGDHSTRSAGYKHKSYPAAGRYLTGDLSNDRTNGYYSSGAASSVTLFTTTKSQLPHMRMDGWSWIYTDNATTATGIMIRPGYVQVGTGSVNNCLATPALTNMPAGNSSLRITFKACPYGAASTSLSSDEQKEKVIAVRAHTGGSVGSDYQLTGSTVVAEHVFTLEGDNNSVWKEYTVDLHYIPQGARISFGSGRTDYGSNRWHIDDVKIQLLNNSDIAVGLVRATDTTLNIGWTVTEGNAQDDKFLTYLPASAASSKDTPTNVFDFNSIDNQHTYVVYLYNDEACTDLYQSWTLDSSFFHDGKTTTNGVTTYSYAYPTRFIFSGLTPSTDYYVRVQDKTQGITSSAIKMSTVAPQYQGKAIVTDPINLVAGNTILFNNFGKLYYGGDLAGFAAGYDIDGSVTSTTTENYNAQGANPYNNDTRTDFNRAACSNYERGLFTTVAGLLDDYGMSDWSYMSDDGSCRVHVKAGYVKMGGASQRSTLVTPLLTSIPEGEVWSVKVRFKACPFTSYSNYYHDTTEDDIHVSVYEGGEVVDYKFVNGGVMDSKTINIGGHVGEWVMHEVTLDNVTCDCRIGIGSARASAGQSRFFLDDIEVIAANASQVKYLTGYVKDASGNGVEGVMVTDGYHVVKTNSKGKYRMVYDTSVYKPEYVYYTTPADYEIGRAGTGLPVTYYKVGDQYLKPDEGDYAKDFTLDAKMTASTHRDFNETTGKHDKWYLFVMADPQTHDSSVDNGFERFRDIVAPDIKTKSASWNSAVNSSSGAGQAYGVICGDVTWNAPEAHHKTMKSALEVGDTGVYWFAAPGNHDWYQGDSDSSPDISHFKDIYGPTRISFDRGDMHVVVMNNVITKDGSTKLGVKDYQAGFTEEEITWLKNDLSHVDKNKGVVLVVHIPFRGGVAAGKKDGTSVMKDRYYDVVLTELAKFQHAYIFSGHTHKNQTYVHTSYPTAGGDYVTEVVHCSASGSLWNVSAAPDGSPAGYTIYTFEGNRAKVQRFKAVGYSGSMDASEKATVWKNNMRMYWGAGSTTGTAVSTYRWNATKKRVVANVFMSHSAALYDSSGQAIASPKIGTPGELSGDWVVQLYDPKTKKWTNMHRIEKSRIEQAPNWTTFKFNVSEAADFLITPDGVTKASGATEPNDGWRIRNDVDWWWWSCTIDGNSNIIGRSGSALGSQADTESFQSSCTHVWYGDLSYELTADEVKGSSHGVKVRAIPPYYGTNTTVQNAITNGTDLSGYGIIYICDTFTQWDSKVTSRTAANSKPLSWSTVKNAY